MEERVGEEREWKNGQVNEEREIERAEEKRMV